MQYLIATTFEVVHYIALQAVHYKPLQEVHLSRYNHGPGAKVLGKVTIGDNSFVLANAVVTKDMPENSIIGGVPAKVLKVRE